jgi:DNA-binding HxlR family transcriptional regulator
MAKLPEEISVSYRQNVLSAAKLLQAKWMIEILCAVRERPVRLSELKRKFPLASKKALTARLRYLEAARIVQRRDLSGAVLHVEYSLTDNIQTPLGTLLDSFAEWGKLHGSGTLRATSDFSSQSHQMADPFPASRAERSKTIVKSDKK